MSESASWVKEKTTEGKSSPREADSPANSGGPSFLTITGETPQSPGGCSRPEIVTDKRTRGVLWSNGLVDLNLDPTNDVTFFSLKTRTKQAASEDGSAAEILRHVDFFICSLTVHICNNNVKRTALLKYTLTSIFRYICDKESLQPLLALCFAALVQKHNCHQSGFC